MTSRRVAVAGIAETNHEPGSGSRRRGLGHRRLFFLALCSLLGRLFALFQDARPSNEKLQEYVEQMTAEFGERTEIIRSSCAEHKRLVLGYLESLARAAGARDPADLAFALNLLAEGAIVSAQVMGTMDAAQRAKKSAAILIGEALEPATVQ